MKKGFTLMEILFVVLIIALILSFAVPAVRSVRYDAKNARAKAALRKLAEAQRNFYKDNKGGEVSGSFKYSDLMSLGSCSDVPMLSGVPGGHTSSTFEPKKLFECGYLSAKDFKDLPYEFSACARSGLAANCTSAYFAVAVPTAEAGKYNKAGYLMHIGREMQVAEENAP